MHVSMDWLPTGPACLRLHRTFSADGSFVDALSPLQTLQREAGNPTDDPHHPALTLPDNVYTICGVIASINRYMLRLLMQKA